MSNLGCYQWFTTNAKRVGGPLKLMGLIAIAGYVVIRTGEIGAKKAIKLVKKHNEDKVKDTFKKNSVCKVIADANIEEGVDVKIGDKIKVCAIDGEAVMIEILSNKNNPYFIDINLLKSITDYK